MERDKPEMRRRVINVGTGATERSKLTLGRAASSPSYNADKVLSCGCLYHLALARSGTLEVAGEGAPVVLDSHVVAVFSSFAVLGGIYDGLVEIGPEPQVEPAPAESWEVSDGGLIYAFTLRDNRTAVFTPEEPLTPFVANTANNERPMLESAHDKEGTNHPPRVTGQ